MLQTDAGHRIREGVNIDSQNILRSTIIERGRSDRHADNRSAGVRPTDPEILDALRNLLRTRDDVARSTQQIDSPLPELGMWQRGSAREANLTLGQFRARESAAGRRQEDVRQAAQHKLLRDVEAELSKTAQKVAAATRERISQHRDDEIYVTPGLPTLTTEADRQAYNKRELAAFVRTNPDFSRYEPDSTVDRIGDYFARNGVVLADASMIWRSAASRQCRNA